METKLMSALELDVWNAVCSQSALWGTRAVDIGETSDSLAKKMTHEMFMAGLRLLQNRKLVIIGQDGFAAPGPELDEFPLPTKPMYS